jgi:hypothetical protein
MSHVQQVSMNVPQAQFLAMPHKYRAFVAGFGSGKTWVGCAGLGQHFMEFPKINAGYFGPSYPHIRDIFYPTIEEALFDWGLQVKIAESNKEVGIYQGRQYRGTVICRSMDRPESIIGFKIGKALVDEIDVLKKAKALLAWRKIIARMRYLGVDLKNGIDVTTTPEGFNFVHMQFVEEIKKKPEMAKTYGLIQASTYDNALNLPEDYIPSLLMSYPDQLIAAYINGQFTNLRTGTIYKAYDRLLNNTDVTMEEGEPLCIGMDFNVGSMAAIAHVKRNGLPRAVDEIINAYDTPDMIRILKERYWKWDAKQERFVATRTITIYPDGSGDSRKTVNASSTDISLLKAAGFRVNAPNANPPVKDRINATNAMFCNAVGERRYLVNADKCPTYANCLEQQAWGDNGEPDKTTGFDHPNDAGTYFIHKDYPIKRFSTGSKELIL